MYADEDRGFGWLFFAGSILGLAGIMRIIDSIWAFTYKGALPENLKNGVLGDNLKTYGWVWLGVGVVLLIASFLVVTRSQVARWFGIIAASLAAISAITWMPYYPVWSLVYIGLAIGVIYALSVYGGRELR
jgi:hypothetical protein